jgi:hypothetical protein
MKTLLLTAIASLCSATIFSQTITWSPDLVKPAETETNSTLVFPGTDASSYYAVEYELGTRTVKKKFRSYVKKIDKSSLKVVAQKDVQVEVPLDGRDYINARNFLFQDKQYYFFVDEKDQDVYKVYSFIQNTDGSNAAGVKQIQKVDITKYKVFKSSYSAINHKTTNKMEAAIALNYVNIKPAYNNKSIISAMVTEKVDDNYSTLNVSEWDENLKAKVSNNYKIPFLARQKMEKTIFGSAGTASGDQADILDFAKDNNGFVYVLLQSENPDDKKEANIYWLYQFKLSDPSFVKTYRKELVKNRTAIEIKLFQDESGKIFVSSLGMEIEKEKDKDDNYRVNGAFIGSFDEQGNLVTIFSKQLPATMMYNFETEKRVDKDGYVNSISIENILPTSDGGCFVIWQREWTEIKENNVNSKNTISHIYYHSDNALVQYYNKANKMVWEKPIYKEQKSSSKIANIYSDLASTVVGGKLCVFYPDDPKNADKAVDDQKVSEYNVVKFANKDLAGMFVAMFDTKGTYTRQYIKWPEDKIGFALCTNSFSYIGNNEVIGAVRKIKQGALFLKSEEYTFFKLKF